MEPTCPHGMPHDRRCVFCESDDSGDLDALRAENAALKAKMEEAERDTADIALIAHMQGVEQEQDRSAALTARVQALESRLAAEIVLATCACGDRFNAWNRGICPNCLQAERDQLQSDLCDYENRDKAHIHSIDSLLGENAALTARVEALESIRIPVEKVLGLTELDPWIRRMLEDAEDILNSTPALDLSAHDARIKRDAVEKIIEANHGLWGSNASKAQVRTWFCRAASIPPSTETPTPTPTKENQ